MIGMEFLRAGDAIFTAASLKTGARYTYRIQMTEPTERYPKPSIFVKLLTGPDNTSDYTYLGRITEEGKFTLTAKSSQKADSAPVKAFDYVWSCIAKIGKAPGVEISHCGRCGRCARLLTTPESVERGIGPECIKKMAA